MKAVLEVTKNAPDFFRSSHDIVLMILLLVLLVAQGVRGLLVGIVVVALLLRVRLLRLLGDRHLSCGPSFAVWDIEGSQSSWQVRTVQETGKASGHGIGAPVSSSVEGEERRTLAVERKVKSCTREAWQC